jgi:hypothetical protein
MYEGYSCAIIFSALCYSFLEIKCTSNWALVAHACHPRYLGDWDPEDRALRPAGQIVRETPSPKITGAK